MSVGIQPLPLELPSQDGPPTSMLPPPQRGRRHLSRTVARVLVLVAADAAVLLGVAALAHAAAGSGSFGPRLAGILAWILPAGELPALQFLTAGLLGLFVADGYTVKKQSLTFGRPLVGAGLGLAPLYWSHLWGGRGTVVVGYLVLAATVATALFLVRRVLDVVLRRVGPVRLHAARVLLVAGGPDIRRANKHPALADQRDFVIAGVFGPEQLRRPRRAFEELCEAVRRSDADTIMLCCGQLCDEAFAVLADAAVSTGCGLIALTRSPTVARAEPRMAWSHGAPLVVLARPVARTVQLVLKRMIDVAGGIAGLMMLAPVLVLVACTIRLESRGPVLFAQRRLGLGARPFRCFKFRSMRVNAEAALRADPKLYAEYLRKNFKLPEDRDPRITRVGRFLRKTSLDEFPQLWNVVRGEMSLVGPRPIVPAELGQYGERAALFLSVKPGISGAWAVNGRSLVGYPDRADMELAYVRGWRVGLDFSILARTVPAVFARRGAH